MPRNHHHNEAVDTVIRDVIGSHPFEDLDRRVNRSELTTSDPVALIVRLTKNAVLAEMGNGKTFTLDNLEEIAGRISDGISEVIHNTLEEDFWEHFESTINEVLGKHVKLGGFSGVIDIKAIISDLSDLNPFPYHPDHSSHYSEAAKGYDEILKESVWEYVTGDEHIFDPSSDSNITRKLSDYVQEQKRKLGRH